MIRLPRGAQQFFKPVYLLSICCLFAVRLFVDCDTANKSSFEKSKVLWISCKRLKVRYNADLHAVFVPVRPTLSQSSPPRLLHWSQSTVCGLPSTLHFHGFCKQRLGRHLCRRLISYVTCTYYVRTAKVWS